MEKVSNFYNQVLLPDFFLYTPKNPFKRVKHFRTGARGSEKSGTRLKGSDNVLPVEELDRKIDLVLDGDIQAREELIDIYRAFVARVAARVCGRALEWGRDDELSIGLLAFNEALDRFDRERGVPFLAFARLIIKSRLTDFLRKQARHAAHHGGSLDFEEGTGPVTGEITRAWEEYWKSESARERQDEIIEYNKTLAGFGISFQDLVRCAPKHRDARAVLLRVSRTLAENEQMFISLASSKKMPVNELAAQTGVHRKTLERGRKYIIATALIWHYCEDFLYLCSFLKPSGKEGSIR